MGQRSSPVIKDEMGIGVNLFLIFDSVLFNSTGLLFVVLGVFTLIRMAGFPGLLSAPAWEIDKIPRFSQAVKALFADLTPFLKGDAIDSYPMLGTLPTAAWQYA